MSWKLQGIFSNGSLVSFRWFCCVVLNACMQSRPFIGLIYICLFVLILYECIIIIICNVIIFIFSFTEYLTAFCIQNEKEYPNAKEVNSAFTQQITYARVKVSRRAKLI